MRKPTPITSRDFNGEAMTLVDEKTFAPIMVGDKRTLRDGERHTVYGGRAPHKPGSSGKVWTQMVGAGDGRWSCEYYPAVIGAKWMHDTSIAAYKHAESPEIISAVNKARQKARRHKRLKRLIVAAALLVAGPAVARDTIGDMLKTDQGTYQVIAVVCAEQLPAASVASCTKHVYMMCVQAGSRDAKANCIMDNVRRRR